MPSEGHELASAEAEHAVEAESRGPQGLILILQIRYLEATAPDGSAEELVETVLTEEPVDEEARSGTWGVVDHLVEEGLL